ncbi:MAG: PD-(D/E)XK nuclease family protein [Anaerovoracaceae bacterium]|jgi:ATP-dependent helicase/nuclease subunit B
MINIYYAGENINREQFVCREIARRGYGPKAGAPRTLILVPDQYTVEAERQVFRLLETECLMGVDVYSISRLGHQILSKSGPGSAGGMQFIDKYGRQMLLTRILRQHKEELEVYSGSTEKSTFVEMVNDFISELKQYDVGSDDLTAIAETFSSDGLLSRKLRDLGRIFGWYEEEIRGKYTDSEDRIDLYVQQAAGSSLVLGSRIWVYGFDSIAPKMLRVLTALMQGAGEMNIVLNLEEGPRQETLFGLTDQLRGRLLAAAKEAGCEIGEVRPITGEEFLIRRKSDAIGKIERELYQPVPAAGGAQEESADPNGEKADGAASPNGDAKQEAADQRGKAPTGEAAQGSAAANPKEEAANEIADDGSVTILRASNPEAEAESAAAFVKSLIRDEGMRYRDIALIVNDQDGTGEIVRRVFAAYGLPVFRDVRRSILDSGAAVFLLSSLNAAAGGYRTPDVIAALKTGFGPVSPEDAELLENYAGQYRIRGAMWKTPFQRQNDRYGRNDLEKVERIRQTVMASLEKLEAVLNEAADVRAFADAFYRFLTEEAEMPEKLDRLAEEQEEWGRQDLAQETGQVWGSIVHLLDQIVGLAGDEPFDAPLFIDMFSFGLAQIDVGVLPESVDNISMGTIQRSRLGEIRALLVIGASDGVIPQGLADDGLFSIRELDEIAAGGKEIVKSDAARIREERLAIYRNFSRPTEKLWISWSQSGSQGEEQQPSELIGDIRRILPYLTVKRDIVSENDPMALIQAPAEALDHLSRELNNRKYRSESEAPDPVWDALRDWFAARGDENLSVVERGLAFRNRPQRIDKDLIARLLPTTAEGSFVLSASSLEDYAGCPFRFFVNYGLKAEERREYGVDTIEFGQIYHESLRTLTDLLETEDLWDRIDPEELDEKITAIVRAKAGRFNDGVFGYSARERYLKTRVETVCRASAAALVAQHRKGKGVKSRHEEPFGRGRRIGPVEYEADGRTFVIEGIIDRYDELENGRVKVIDYKSRNITIREEDVRGGLMLQLMIYGKALENQGSRLAGLFYFHIHRPEFQRRDFTRTDADAVEKKAEEDYRMNGIVIEDEETLKEIDEDLASDGSVNSSVIGVKRNAKGEWNTQSSTILMSEEEYQEFEKEFDEEVVKLCENLAEGSIDIHPAKRGTGQGKTECRYCSYREICSFDERIDGFRFRDVRKR